MIKKASLNFSVRLDRIVHLYINLNQHYEIRFIQFIYYYILEYE